MGDDKIETFKGKPTLVIPVAAWVSILVFAWNLGASWVHFRDTVFERLHALDVRYTEIASRISAIESSERGRADRVDKLDDRIDRIRDEHGKSEGR